MKILEIYQKYQIMPQLAEHQLRVAAVAGLMLDHLSLVLDKNEILAACLLHDMGNIVKFDLRVTEKLFPGDFQDQSLMHWQQVQREFVSRYGNGSHNVTAKIIKELGVSGRIFALVDCVGFEQGRDNAQSPDFGKKICAYSDMRVMPRGVCSLEERMVDLRVRYKNHPEGAGNREQFEQALREIERQIFEHSDIRPEDISEQAIGERKEKLKLFQISTRVI